MLWHLQEDILLLLFHFVQPFLFLLRDRVDSGGILYHYPKSIPSHLVLEKEMATHSSTLAWKIPWTEEPGRLQSMGLLRVGHDWVTSLSLFTFMHWRRTWQPTPVFLPGGSQGPGGAWWAAIYGVTQGWTWPKWLSSSSSSFSLFYCCQLSVLKCK